MSRAARTRAPPARTLLLIRHARSQADPDRPPEEWPLAARGPSGAASLAPMLARFGPGRLLSSPEPKARQTAEILGRHLDLDVRIIDGLREHDRTGVPFFESQEEFERRVAEVFERPTERVLGGESGAEACRRFTAALEDVLASSADECIAFVTHGTVMSLYLGSLGTVDPLRLWRLLGMPAYAAVEWPTGRLIELAADPTSPDHA